jgi:hypothetical protein
MDVVPACAELVLQVFMNIDHRSEWDENWRHGVLLQRFENGVECLHNMWKSPSSLITARDVVSARRVIRKPDGSIWYLACSVDHPQAPPPDTGGYVRANLKFDGTIITPIDADSCRVTYLIDSDLRGM